MDSGDKPGSRVMAVLSRAFAGSIVDRREVTAAIREFEELMSTMQKEPSPTDMVSLRRAEVDNMRDIIRHQDEKIRNMDERLNKGSLRVSPAPGLETDRNQVDTERRLELADRFNAVFEHEWRAAYSELRASMYWRELECVYTLMRVIRNACDMCLQLSEDQVDKLVLAMEDVVLDPLNGNAHISQAYTQYNSEVYSDGMREAQRFALQYRAGRAEASVSAVIQLFTDTKLQAIIDPRYLRRDFKRYIDKVVELVWLMTTLEPRMRLYWQRQNERVNQDFFYLYRGQQGEYVNQTVWPAVFMHNTGRLIYKGQITPV
ncbi:uncharacterized protein LOC128242157 [Mya arenaria]|uniref:uncharacterized protein LOC128242157 n=1 Tax=Mya arenaria TaxID=6604 RepID=UPI0022E73AE7|nr:uncharacterized protein LOC128242157 [Mya arenaria]